MILLLSNTIILKSKSCGIVFFRKLSVRRVGGAGQRTTHAHLPSIHCQPAGLGCQAHGGRGAHGLQQSGPVPFVLSPLPHEPWACTSCRACAAQHHESHANLWSGQRQRHLPGICESSCCTLTLLLLPGYPLKSQTSTGMGDLLGKTKVAAGQC